MTNHTTKTTFKVHGFIAAMATVAIPVMGIFSAQTAMAEPNTTPAPKASCTWGGATTSDGGYHGNQWHQLGEVQVCRRHMGEGIVVRR